MDIQAAAAMQIQSLALANARVAVERAQANPVPASAPVAVHAGVILELSSGAQSLLSS